MYNHNTQKEVKNVNIRNLLYNKTQVINGYISLLAEHFKVKNMELSIVTVLYKSCIIKNIHRKVMYTQSAA